MKSLKIYLVEKQRVMNPLGCTSAATFKLEDRSALAHDAKVLPSMGIGHALIEGDNEIKKDNYDNNLKFVDCNLLAEY